MIETLVLAALIVAVVVWWRNRARRRQLPYRPSAPSYTRQPSLGHGLPPAGQAGDAADAATARQQAFDTFDRFKSGGDPQLLASAADGFRHAAGLTSPGDPRKARDLVHVCTVLQLFYDETTELWALDDAIAAAREALAAGPDADTHGDALLRLGICLCAKFEATKEPAPLAECLDALRAAATRATPDRPLSEASFYHLAAALYHSYNRAHDPALLEEAVAAGRWAARSQGPLQVPALCQLVRHLCELSGIREDPALGQEAEAVARWGARITVNAGAKDRSLCLFELARTLERLGLRTGSVGYLREAAETMDEAIRRTPDPVDRQLRGVIGDGMAKNLRDRQQSASDLVGEPAEGPAEPYGSRPPPPPPLDPTG